VQLLCCRWPALDQAPNSNPTRNTLLEGVSEFKLRYWIAAIIAVDMANDGELRSNSSGSRVKLTLNSGEQISRVFALQ